MNPRHASHLIKLSLIHYQICLLSLSSIFPFRQSSKAAVIITEKGGVKCFPVYLSGTSSRPGKTSSAIKCVHSLTVASNTYCYFCSYISWFGFKHPFYSFFSFPGAAIDSTVHLVTQKLSPLTISSGTTAVTICFSAIIIQISSN